ncbi:GGDEF domain-containing protein [Neorhizobium sp. BT27B]|uniref:sensor domain-containing diguanylate cyclase n=1 Tax=Neorhizobium sp. BT27B TaxID=3142625 RepID=UPI003D2DFF0A
MRLVGMLNPFALAGSEIASPAQVEATLRELYSSKPHVVATGGIALAGLSAAWSGAVLAGARATIVAATCLFLRVVLEYLYCKHATVPVHQRWVSLFVFGSLVCGLGWGVCGAVLLYGASATTQTITVGVACAIVQGAAGRAFMMPGTAFINVAFVLGLMAIAAYLDGNYVIIPACILYYCFLSSFIVQMVGNRMRQLRAEEMNERLLEELTVKNDLLRVANERLAESAFEDPLTGLANRRKFDAAFDEMLVNAQKHQTSISLMMIDVDHFKRFNDTYGHQAGDRCLQVLSTALNEVISQSGLLARYGGEEFVAILPDSDLSRASVVAERARHAAQVAGMAGMGNCPPPQSVSIGLVSCAVCPGISREMILAAADAALYAAKQQGRNRVCIGSNEGLAPSSAP